MLKAPRHQHDSSGLRLASMAANVPWRSGRLRSLGTPPLEPAMQREAQRHAVGDPAHRQVEAAVVVVERGEPGQIVVAIVDEALEPGAVGPEAGEPRNPASV